jgi:hypothetical protein
VLLDFITSPLKCAQSANIFSVKSHKNNRFIAVLQTVFSIIDLEPVFIKIEMPFRLFLRLSSLIFLAVPLALPRQNRSIGTKIARKCI